MIRKLRTGEYRIYSKNKDPKPISEGTWALSIHWMPRESTKDKFNISKETRPFFRMSFFTIYSTNEPG